MPHNRRRGPWSRLSETVRMVIVLFFVILIMKTLQNY